MWEAMPEAEVLEELAAAVPELLHRQSEMFHDLAVPAEERIIIRVDGRSFSKLTTGASGRGARRTR